MSKKSYQRNLPVPFFCQRDNTYVWQQEASKDGYQFEGVIYNKGEKFGPGHSLGLCTCNVTSLCMVLNYYGITTDTPNELLKKVFSSEDEGLKILRTRPTGYAPFWESPGQILQKIANVIYGVPEKYLRFKEKMSLDTVKGFIERGHPVIFSYGAAAERWSYRGHIAVIRGFTEADDIIINEPWGDPVDWKGDFKADNVGIIPGYYVAAENNTSLHYGLSIG